MQKSFLWSIYCRDFLHVLWVIFVILLLNMALKHSAEVLCGFLGQGGCAVPCREHMC